MLIAFVIATWFSTFIYSHSDHLIAFRAQIGLGLAICLLGNARTLWSVGATQLASGLLVRVGYFGEPAWGSLITSCNICVTILAIYFVTRWICGPQINFRNWKHLFAFIAISSATSLVSGLLFAFQFALPGMPLFSENWKVWTISTVTGCTLVTPAAALVASADIKRIFAPWKRILATLFALALALAVTFLYASFSAVSVIILGVLFVALAFGVELSALSLVVLDIGYTATIATGIQPPALPLFSAGQQMLALQASTVFAALILLPSAAAISARHELLRKISDSFSTLSKAQRKLEESEVRYRLLAENSSDIILRTSLDGQVLYVSPAIRRVLGYDPAELIGLKALPFIHPSDHESIPSPGSASAGKDGVHDILKLSFRGMHKNGSVVVLESQTSAAFNPDGTSAGFISVVRDITEKKLAEDKLAELRAELAHVERMDIVDQMSAGIAHELNQPLAAVVNYCGAAKRYAESDDGKGEKLKLLHLLDSAVAQSIRAAEIVKSLRDFASKSPRPRKREALYDVIQDAVKMLVMGTAFRNLVKVKNCSPNLPIMVLMDRVQIQQVVQNLLRNALGASESVNATPVVVSMGVENDSFAYFEVEDNGTGVPSEQVPNLFKSFSSTKADGMGIGLALSKTLVEAHGGTVELIHNSPTGACFRVRLPILTG